MYEHTDRKPGGTLIMTDAAGKVTEKDTKTCCHCNKVWEVKPGSGAIRGFCFKCNKHHCGDPGCWECNPFEKRMEEFEKKIRSRL